jgi:hypothetical protein
MRTSRCFLILARNAAARPTNAAFDVFDQGTYDQHATRWYAQNGNRHEQPHANH